VVGDIFILGLLVHLMIIGVVGPIASGKSVMIELLIENGFTNLRVSDVLKEEATKLGIPLERKPLQDLGNKLRAENGEGYLAEQLVRKMDDGRNYVVDSIRNPGEIEVLKRIPGFVLIGFDAPIEKRIQWIVLRNKFGDPRTEQEIREMEARDRGEGEGNNGQQVWKCYEMADLRIVNDGNLEELFIKINEVMKEAGFSF